MPACDRMLLVSPQPCQPVKTLTLLFRGRDEDKEANTKPFLLAMQMVAAEEYLVLSFLFVTTYRHCLLAVEGQGLPVLVSLRALGIQIEEILLHGHEDPSFGLSNDLLTHRSHRH